MHQKSDILILREGDNFVETPYIKELTDRAASYIRAGFPVNLSGPAGVGKTTLAFHIAAQIGRPAVLMCGDYEYATSDLVGGLYGYHKKYMRDNFIRSVVKTDETMTQHWIDNRLTTACQHGLTLVYDEFTRSRPEANNILLSILEEKILVLPGARGGDSYLKVHPDFRAIFTSNPEEYAGVQKSQDALRDRMVTIEVGNFDEETEIAITLKKSELSPADCRHIVGLVRRVREVKSNKLTPTVRACIMIGKILNLIGEVALDSNHTFRQVCFDILLPEVPNHEREMVRQLIDDMVPSYSL
ncbi:MAG: gas vesicle protein GvpN [Chloroflexi bacterium]|nr:gas vesicle protein GvpN [Chloroflexota bacterium]